MVTIALTLTREFYHNQTATAKQMKEKQQTTATGILEGCLGSLFAIRHVSFCRINGVTVWDWRRDVICLAHHGFAVTCLARWSIQQQMSVAFIWKGNLTVVFDNGVSKLHAEGTVSWTLLQKQLHWRRTVPLYSWLSHVVSPPLDLFAFVFRPTPWNLRKVSCASLVLITGSTWEE